MVITIKKSITCLATHPVESKFLALGFVDGEIRFAKLVHSFTSKEVLKTLWRRRLRKSVRGLSFSNDGKFLYSIGANYSLCVIDISTGKRVRCIVKSHDSKPTALHVFPAELTVRNQSLITGDESGQIKTWNLEEKAPIIATYDDQEERINSFAQYKSLALASSSDGTLATYDLRHNKLKLHSEVMNGELTSIVTLEKHTYVGSSDGSIEVFNNNEFGNILQRIETKLNFGVWSLLEVRPNLLLAGSDFEPELRFIHVNPNKRLKSMQLEGGTDLLALDSSKELLFVAGLEVDNLDHTKLHVFALDELLKNVPMLTAQNVNKLRKGNQNSVDFFKDLIEENGDESSSERSVDDEADDQELSEDDDEEMEVDEYSSSDE